MDFKIIAYVRLSSSPFFGLMGNLMAAKGKEVSHTLGYQVTTQIVYNPWLWSHQMILS